MAEGVADARLQLRDVEGVMDAGVDVEGDRRAVRPSAGDHVAAAIGRGPVVLVADQDQRWRRQVRGGDAAAGVIEDRGAEPLGEILRAQVVIERVEPPIDWPRTAMRAGSTSSSVLR